MDGLYIGDRYVKGPVFYPNQVATYVRHTPSIIGTARAATCCCEADS